MNPLLDAKSARLDPLPLGLGTLLVPEGDRLLGCVDRRPYILTAPFGANWPDFIQYFDCTALVDFAQEMYPSSRQRQTPLWNDLTQASAQQPYARTAPHLCRCLTRECWWIVLLHIPAPEQHRLGFDLATCGELVSQPKAADPRRVKAFDLIVALGFVIGREQRLDPAEQTQTYDLTKDVGMGVPATEGTFVVELVQAGQSQCCPGFEQVGATGAAGLVQMLRQVDGVREVIDGMKVLDFCSTTQMLGDDVGSENRIGVPGHWPGVVSSGGSRAERMGQVVLSQNTLNGRDAGQGRDTQFLETRPDRARTNQAVPGLGGVGLFEKVPKREHGSNKTGGH